MSSAYGGAAAPGAAAAGPPRFAISDDPITEGEEGDLTGLAGYVLAVAAHGELAAPLDSAERRRRRQAVLDTLREANELRARLRPRSSALARSRTLLHNRTTRG